MRKGNDNYMIQADIEVAFARLIGPLSIMGVLDSYKRRHNEIKEISDTIIRWGAKFQLSQSLSFISREELLDVYNKLEKIKEEFLFDPTLENESELSDEVTIWMWEIMELRKKQIERMKQ